MLTKCKVYIRGAYGPGNIGDDVLMLSVIRMLQARFSANEIYVGVEAPEVAKKLQPDVNWIHIKKPVDADLVVLGGGGQFFSFIPPLRESDSLATKLSGAFEKVRRQSGVLDSVKRMYVGKRGGFDKLYFHKRLASFCIGLGPFDGGGYGELRAREFLKRCDYLSVRDSVSAEYCSKYGRPDSRVFVDPTLLSDLWVEKEIRSEANTAVEGDKSLTFILRDWPHDAKGQAVTENIIECARRFKKEGRKVRLCSVYKSRDAHLLEKYRDFPWIVWDPNEGRTPGEFISMLIRTSSSIISSRAHGVLLPAVLGEPTIAVAIEEKLRQVHKMLPKGTRLVEGVNATDLYDEVLSFERDKEVMRSALVSEVHQGALIVQSAVADFLRWVDGK